MLTPLPANQTADPASLATLSSSGKVLVDVGRTDLTGPGVSAGIDSSAHGPERIVALLFALSAMSYFDRVAISIAGPGIMKDFHISETEMGTVFSAFLLSYTVMMAPGGALGDRFGGRLFLTVAGVGSALFTGLTAVCGPQGLGAYVGVLPAFLVIRLAFGVCVSPIYPSMARIVSAWIAPGGRARVQSLIVSGAAVGSAVAPVLFSYLIGAYGWRGAFWIAAAATTILIMIWHSWVRDRPPSPIAPELAAREPIAGSWRMLLGDRQLLLVTGSYSALSYFQYIFYYWIYYYFGEIRGMGEEQSAFATTVIFITMAIMAPLGGWMSDHLTARFGPKRGLRMVPVGAMTASAVLLHLGVSGLGDFATVGLLALAVGCCVATEGAFWATSIHMGGKQVGAACGIVNCGGNVGGMLAPIMTPLVAQRFGWTGALSFASFVVLIGMLAWLAIDPTHRVGRPAESADID